MSEVFTRLERLWSRVEETYAVWAIEHHIGGMRKSRIGTVSQHGDQRWYCNSTSGRGFSGTGYMTRQVAVAAVLQHWRKYHSQTVPPAVPLPADLIGATITAATFTPTADGNLQVKLGYEHLDRPTAKRTAVMDLPTRTPAPWKPSPADNTAADAALLDSIRYTLHRVSEGGKRPLFTIAPQMAALLYDKFLETLPTVRLNAIYNCRSCRDFVTRYGGLVVINTDGTTTSAIWGPTVDGLEHFRGAVAVLRRYVESCPVDSAFVSNEPSLGKATDGAWHHMSANNPAMWRDGSQTPYQRAADLNQRYEALSAAYQELRFNKLSLDTAKRLLPQLSRNERIAGHLDWLYELLRKCDAMRVAGLRDNVDNWLRLAAAVAPPGYANVKSSVLGSLLADIDGHFSDERVVSRFNARMDPMVYQRPQTLPTASAVVEAERIVASLGLAGALERRRATIGEVSQFALWEPRSTGVAWRDTYPGPANPVFSHVPTRDARPSAAYSRLPRSSSYTVGGATSISWADFRDEVLPRAASMTVRLSASVAAPLTPIVTAADRTARPILQWDRAAVDRFDRNPFSWYCYKGGVPAAAMGLSTYAEVASIVPLPSQFGLDEGDTVDAWGQGTLFLLKGARDTTGRGYPFFVESLIAELHPHRRTMEAYAQQYKLLPAPADGTGEAVGWDLRKGAIHPLRVKVTSFSGDSVTYLINSWAGEAQ